MNKIKNDQSAKKVTKAKKQGRPRKLFAELSPGYRKRLQSGKAKGLSRSQAYGHPKQKEEFAKAIQALKHFCPNYRR